MAILKDMTVDQLFQDGGEQPGSQRAYDRNMEIMRRQFLLDKEVAEAQIAAADAQKLAADATKATSLWTMVSAIAVAITVVITAIGVWFDVFPKN